MTLCVRAAETGDIAAIAPLLLEDAAFRERLNPGLWAVARDAPERVRASLATIGDLVTGPFRHHWLVAEADGVLQGVVHAMNVPPPPLFDLMGGNAGVVLDDSHFPADDRIAATLLQAAERALMDAGAVLLVAASPADWTARTAFLVSAGYEKTTVYMAKSELSAAPSASAVRRGSADDIGGIVRLSALHRKQLQAASPVFWNVHPKADTRFASWMGVTLTLADRTLFVSGAANAIEGFIIAQPGSPLHLPPAHDLARIGQIDDFHALAFEPGWAPRMPSGEPAALLAAAESELRDRGARVALAICPVRMERKIELHLSQGYMAANLWLVKDRP